MPPALILLLFPLLFHFADPSPVHPSDRQSSPSCPLRLFPPAVRIVGGKQTPPSSFPFVVALHSSTSFLCTGFLLSPRWILSAAHCNFPPFDTIAHLLAPTRQSGFRIPVAQVITPSQNNLSHPSFPRDIALLHLSAPAPTNIVFPILNSNDSLPVPSSYARLAGYGSNSRNNPNLDQPLRFVDLPVVDPNECFQAYETYMTTDRLCAGYVDSPCDPCEGDDGAPLLQYDDDGNPIAVGLVSGGFLCAQPNYPVMYTRVSSYIDWMDSVGASFKTSDNAQQVMIAGSLPPFQPLPSASPLPASSTSTVGDCPDVLPTQSDPDLVAKHLASFFDIFGYRCTGVVVSERWILTSAGCAVHISDTVFIGGTTAENGEPASIERVFVPQRWANEPEEDSGRFNYAAVQLKENVPSSSSFALLNANQSLPMPGAFARAAVYGSSQDISMTGDAGLRLVDVPILENQQCQEFHPWLQPAMMCAGYPEGGCLPCRTDAAPLLQFDDEGRAVVVGLAVHSGDCSTAEQRPVFIRTSSMLNWLERIGVDFERTSKFVQVLSTSMSPTTSPSDAEMSVQPSPTLSEPLVEPDPSPSMPSEPSDSPNETEPSKPSETSKPSEPSEPPESERCATTLSARRISENDVTTRIVGGSPVFESDAVYMVSLWSNGNFECSAVRLSSRWVLTVARCAVDTSWTVQIGLVEPDANAPRIEIEEVFSGQEDEPGNELVLILLRTEEELPESVSASLPKLNANDSLPLEGAFTQLVGYGSTDGSVDNPEQRSLHFVDVPVEPISECETGPEENEETGFCAGFSDRNCGACHGDSGGPVLQFDGSGEPVVVGLVVRDDSCETGEVGYVVRTSSFLDWIGEVGAGFQTSTEAVQTIGETEDSEEGSGISRVIVIIFALLITAAALGVIIALVVILYRSRTQVRSL